MYTSDVPKTMTYPMITTVVVFSAYNRVYFLQNKSLIIVHVFRGVKYCLNIFHRR